MRKKPVAEVLLLIAASLMIVFCSMEFPDIGHHGGEIEKIKAIKHVSLSGELKKWHRVCLLLNGPAVKEEPATFRDYRLNVTFSKGAQEFVVPGHFAADGDAANSGASSGNKWRVYFTPNETGEWTYHISFRKGKDVAVDSDPFAGSSLTPLDGESGTFTIGPSDKKIPDFRARGLLRYTGNHYQQFAQDGSFWISIGPGSPENLFGYSEIDATRTGMKDQFYPDHIKDWRPGDPLWGNDRGKGVIGALNYLAELGQSSIFVSTMSAFCDSDDTWPYPEKEITVNGMSTFDVSKLDQWEIIVGHAQHHGIVFHAFLGEDESEQIFEKVEGLEMGGKDAFADLRKLYYRELISRLGHFNAVDWNLGEELGLSLRQNNQPYGFPNTSQGQIKLYADYINELEPYGRHSLGFEGDLDKPMEDYDSWFRGKEFTRTAIQGLTQKANRYSVELRRASASAGNPWVIQFSEHHMPDPVRDMRKGLLQIFRQSAWGTFLGGGASVEWWLAEDDFFLTSYRPYKDLMIQTAVARDFIMEYLPFWKMEPGNDLIRTGEGYCFALKGEAYAAYFNMAVDQTLDLREVKGDFEIDWYNPKTGGRLIKGTVEKVRGGSVVSLGQPVEGGGSYTDWVVLVRKN